MEKSYYQQEWEKLKEETKDKPKLPIHVRLAMRSNVGPDGEEDHSNDHKIFKDKVEEIRRERRFYDIMEGKIECSEEMKKFWPIVDTSTNARRQVPAPWPWWYTAIGIAGGLIWFYIILKYLITPN